MIKEDDRGSGRNGRRPDLLNLPLSNQRRGIRPRPPLKNLTRNCCARARYQLPEFRKSGVTPLLSKQMFWKTGGDGRSVER